MPANKLRTFLTMLGMVIGVGAVILMLAIGQGAQFVVKQSIATLGSNLFIILSGSPSTAGVRSGGGNAPTLTIADSRRSPSCRRWRAWPPCTPARPSSSTARTTGTRRSTA